MFTIVNNHDSVTPVTKWNDHPTAFHDHKFERDSVLRNAHIFNIVLGNQKPYTKFRAQPFSYLSTRSPISTYIYR